MKMHLKHNQGRGMCHREKYVPAVEEWVVPCRADGSMSATCYNWFRHFKAAATLRTFMKRNQCGGMCCQERERKKKSNWSKTKNVDEQKHMARRPQVTRERISVMSRPHEAFFFHEPDRLQIIFTSTLWLILRRDTEGWWEERRERMVWQSDMAKWLSVLAM